MKVCPLHYAPYYYWARFNKSTEIYLHEDNISYDYKLFSTAYQKCPKSLCIKDIILFYLNSEKSIHGYDYEQMKALNKNNGEYWICLGISLYVDGETDAAYEAFSNCTNLPKMIHYEVHMLQWWTITKDQSIANYNPYFYYFNDFNANIKLLESKIAELESKYRDEINLSLGVLYKNKGEYCSEEDSFVNSPKKVIYYLSLAMKHKYIDQTKYYSLLQTYYYRQDQTEKQVQLLFQMDTLDFDSNMYIDYMLLLIIYSVSKVIYYLQNENRWNEVVELLNKLINLKPRDRHLIEMRGGTHIYFGNFFNF